MSQVHFHTLQGLGRYMRKTKNEQTLTVDKKMTSLSQRTSRVIFIWRYQCSLSFRHSTSWQLVKRDPQSMTFSSMPQGVKRTAHISCFMGKLPTGTQTWYSSDELPWTQEQPKRNTSDYSVLCETCVNSCMYQRGSELEGGTMCSYRFGPESSSKVFLILILMSREFGHSSIPPSLCPVPLIRVPLRGPLPVSLLTSLLDIWAFVSTMSVQV